jgi:hypothetical protein
MLFLIDISWSHRAPEHGQAATGTTTYAQFARSLPAAKRKANAKFRRHYGTHRAITATAQQPTPAGASA